MSYQHLQVETADAVAIVRLHRPAQRNALNSALMRELTAFALEHRRSADLRAVVLAGSAGHFSGGRDLVEAGERVFGAPPPSLLALRAATAEGQDLTQAWEELEPVTIAAIEGHCVGGGCALVLACDFRIAGAGARFSLPEVPLGMNLGWQSIPRLAALVGPARAKRFTLFGDELDAATGAQWGLVDEVVDAGQAEAQALRWARRVAALPPLPVRMTKEAVNAAAMPMARALSVMDRDQLLFAAQDEVLRRRVQGFVQRRGQGTKA